MTSEGLGEMFEGDSADTGGGKFPLVSMGGRAEGFACADPRARTPIGASRNFSIPMHNLHVFDPVAGLDLIFLTVAFRGWLSWPTLGFSH